MTDNDLQWFCIVLIVVNLFLISFRLNQLSNRIKEMR